jgi:hypothetical protein
MVMAGGFFRGWQPILIIPLAIAVSMRENELNSSIFGAVCGLVIDTAAGKLFGFSGVWLLPGCLVASLLVSHLIKVNFLNFLWLNALMCVFMAVTDYFFRYILFNAENAHIVLTRFIIPEHVSAVVLSPLIYFGVKTLSLKLAPRERIRLSSHSNDDDEEDYL